MSNSIKTSTGRNLNSVKFLKTAPRKIEGKYTKTNIDRIVELAGFIPIELLDRVSKGIVESATPFYRELTDSKGNIVKREIKSPAAGFSGDGLGKAAALALTEVNNIKNIYYSYYRAVIHAMDDLLKNPDIPIEQKTFKPPRVRTNMQTKSAVARDKEVAQTVRFRKLVKLKLRQLGTTDTIELTGTWPGLSLYTIEEKRKEGFAKTFWKHTGEASQAFHSEASRRLSRLRPKDFVGGFSEKKFQLVPMSSSFTGGFEAGQRRGLRQRVSKVTYTIKIGVPTWNQKMDSLITTPFTTGRADISTLWSISPDRFGNRQTKDLQGVDRLLAAEAYRPWLRSLAAQAGLNAEAMIAGTSVGSAGKSQVGMKIKADASRSALVDKFHRVANKIQARVDKAASDKLLKEQKSAQRLADKLARAEQRAARAAEIKAKERSSRERALTENKRIQRGSAKAEQKKLEQALKLERALSSIANKWSAKYGEHHDHLNTTEEMVARAVKRTRVKRKAAEGRRQSKTALTPKQVGFKAQAKGASIVSKSTSKTYRPVDLRMLSRLNKNDFQLRMAAIKRKSI